MTTISATTILRSRNVSDPDKKRVLSTLLLRYPRWIHAEMRTHRQLRLGEPAEFPTPSIMECPDLSRNASSSRAIPVEKLISDITDDAAMPLFWGMNERGMQAFQEGDEYLSVPGHDSKMSREQAWILARDRAIEMARSFSKAGYHKQIANRLLEPFSHINVLVSATEWENFLLLRDHPDAEPHIRMLAIEIRKCLERTDDIQEIDQDQMHLPFVTPETIQYVEKWAGPEIRFADSKFDRLLAIMSIACCASTSYKTVEGFDMAVETALSIYQKLVENVLHASPFEHIAIPDICHTDTWLHPKEHANFVGFRQLRHFNSGEYTKFQIGATRG